VDGVKCGRQPTPHILSRAGETPASRTHHITWTPSGLANWWKASVGELRRVLVPVYYIDNGYRFGYNQCADMREANSRSVDSRQHALTCGILELGVCTFHSLHLSHG
jgi:hypothetical protein